VHKVVFGSHLRPQGSHRCASPNHVGTERVSVYNVATSLDQQVAQPAHVRPPQ
jgi:hypothetical protein